MDDILRDVPETISTERLTLRAPRVGDGGIYHQMVMASINEYAPWFSWAVPAPSADDCEAKMREAQARFLLRREMQYLIFLNETGALIGCTGLHYPEWKVPSFEIGYWAHTAYTGRGLITEAVVGLRDFAFNILCAHRLQIVCNVKNERSAAMARRAGFELEGVLRCSARHHITNELIDEYFFSMVRRG